LAKEVEPAWPIDQFSIRNRISSPGKQIGEADLITYVCRNDNQRRIEETGDSLEKIAEQFVFGRGGSRGRPVI